jgi:predicted RNase H-like HicB family nuclease
LVSIIPAEGIDEALTSLKEILEYHLENVRYKLPEPEIAHRGTGKISEISERPDLVISE